MYTQEMADAFHSLTPPPGFGVDLYDAEEWITVVVDPNHLVDKTEEELNAIVNYINGVKIALEKLGANVLVTREALGE